MYVPFLSAFGSSVDSDAACQSRSCEFEVQLRLHSFPTFDKIQFNTRYSFFNNRLTVLKMLCGVRKPENILMIGHVI